MTKKITTQNKITTLLQKCAEVHDGIDCLIDCCKKREQMKSRPCSRLIGNFDIRSMLASVRGFPHRFLNLEN